MNFFFFAILLGTFLVVHHADTEEIKIVVKQYVGKNCGSSSGCCGGSPCKTSGTEDGGEAHNEVTTTPTPGTEDGGEAHTEVTTTPTPACDSPNVHIDGLGCLFGYYNRSNGDYIQLEDSRALCELKGAKLISEVDPIYYEILKENFDPGYGVTWLDYQIDGLCGFINLYIGTPTIGTQNCGGIGFTVCQYPY